MIVFTAYFCHETNTFSPIPTNLDSFKELDLYRPGMGPTTDKLKLKGASHFCEEAARRGDTAHVGLCAHAQPSRPTQQADYEVLRDWLIEDLVSAGPDIDIILVMMHGSMIAEGYPDCEGDVLTRMRAVAGPDVPIGLLLDLHCNITETMLEQATVIKACKEYPHTDFKERAVELYDICARVRNGELNPTTGFARVPMFGLFQTALPPMRQFVDKLLEKEGSGDAVSITLAHGFPWADFRDAGASVVAVTDNDQHLADRQAADIAAAFFELRESGQTRQAGVDEAIDQALSITEGAAVIADMSDNPGGGAGSDSTFILRRLLERNVTNVAIAYIWDSMSVDLAFAVGEGGTLPLRIGGKVGPGSGDPVDLVVKVLHLRSGANQAHIADGTPTPLGRTAVVTANGIDMALNDIRQQPFTPEGLIACGLDPWAKRILVLKSSHHFYAGFNEKAAQIIYCDAPGTLNSDIRKLPFRNITRPIWPLDDMAWTRVCGIPTAPGADP